MKGRETNNLAVRGGPVYNERIPEATMEIPANTPMPKSYDVYRNLGYWFLLLPVLVFAGFYTTYFSRFLQPKASVIHVHFTLMALWIAMLITQPFLIKYRKLALHRMLGKTSYVLVPLVLLSAFVMVRSSYYQFIELNQTVAPGLNQLSKAQILQRAAAIEAIALFYVAWFILFYILAVANRRRTPIQARYMLATALTLLGPTVDRIMAFGFKLETLPGSIPIESVAFFIADAVLIALLLNDFRNKRPTNALWICLSIYLSGQVLFFTIPGTNWWQPFVTFIMKPEP
jgi:hypothetical protein